MITHVAIRFRGKVYSLPRPNRHHHVIRMIYDLFEEPVDAHGKDQGFLDDSGHYLTRSEAKKHAIACGQLVRESGTAGDPDLYSEDIW